MMGKGLYDLDSRAAAGENGDDRCNRLKIVSAESQDWSELRKAKPAEHLLPLSERFLDQLPPEVFPGALATHYARIVNVIALHWHDRGGCDTISKNSSRISVAGGKDFLAR